jgi:hypothetical protein
MTNRSLDTQVAPLAGYKRWEQSHQLGDGSGAFIRIWDEHAVFMTDAQVAEHWHPSAIGVSVREADPSLPFYPDGLRYLPWFSTNIEAAWLLVEALELTVGPWGRDTWFAGQMQDGAIDGWDVWAKAPTAAEAICLAALKAGSR